MIECPICHVMNEDMARFCAECGQRLATTAPAPAPQAQAPQPPREAPPQPRQPEITKPASAKLHSPLLDREAGGPPAGGEDARSDLSRLRGTAPRGPAEQERPPGGKSLRSPLLGDAGAEPGEPPAGRPRRGLHSPLLGAGEAEPEPDEPTQPRKGRGLRSPLLSGADDDYEEPQRPSRGGGGLHSPLLGGGEPDYGGPSRSRPAGGRPGHLHSPLLEGASGSAFDFEPEYEPIDEDDPNILRSPLLAARVPLGDKPLPAAKPRIPEPRESAEAPRERQRYGDFEPAPPSARELPREAAPASPRELPRELPREPAPPSARELPREASDPAGGGPPAGSLLAGHLYATPPEQPAAGRGFPGEAGQPPGPPAGMAESFLGGGPPDAGFQSTPPLAAALGAQAAPASPLPPQPQGPGPAAAPAGPLTASRERARAGSAPSEAEAPPRRRTAPRLLVEDEEEPPLASRGPDRFAPQPGAQQGSSGLSMMLVIPLVAALAMKGWSLLQFASANQLMTPYLIDQIGQGIVIVCLIVLCVTGGRR